MGEEVTTWRELLGKAVFKPEERQKLAGVLRINAITIARWVTGSSNPRPETLRALPAALPEYREQMIALLKKEYPGLFAEEPVKDAQLLIPPEFYAYVLNTYSMHPERLRSSKLISSVLQQIIHQLDPAQMDGFAAFIAQCVPPDKDHQKVRSLRITAGYGGQPAKAFANQTFFCGAESQAGLAVLSAHFVVIQHPEEAQRIIPNQFRPIPGSSLAIPIMHYDSVAGCACFLSPQRNYFSSERITLLKHYVDILAIAFELHDFYPLPEINLAMMPPRPRQLPLLSDLQQRITDYMLIPSPDGQFLSWLEAEHQAIKEKEELLIQFMLNMVAPV